MNRAGEPIVCARNRDALSDDVLVHEQLRSCPLVRLRQILRRDGRPMLPVSECCEYFRAPCAELRRHFGEEIQILGVIDHVSGDDDDLGLDRVNGLDSRVLDFADLTHVDVSELRDSQAIDAWPDRIGEHVMVAHLQPLGLNQEGIKDAGAHEHRSPT